MNKIWKYNWRYEIKPRLVWWWMHVASHIVSGVGIGVGFAFGQWALSWL